MTPYYDHGGVVIYHGDARDLLPDMPVVDLVLTDPPYGISHQHSGGGRGVGATRNLQPIFGDDQPFDPAPLLRFPRCITWGADHYAQRLPHGRWLAWDKLNGMTSFDTFSDVEFGWDSQRGAARIFRHLWKGVCQDSEKGITRDHPTRKPLALMTWCLGLAPGDSVLDPFAGTGTTLVAAKRLGRRAIGIEIEERYCELAARRLEQGVLPLESVPIGTVAEGE